MKEKLVDFVFNFLSSNPWIAIVFILAVVLIAIFGKVNYQNQSGKNNNQVGRDFNDYPKTRRSK